MQNLLDDAYYVEDVYQLVTVHVGSIEDEGFRLQTGGIVHGGNYVGHVYVARAVGIAQGSGQRGSRHHVRNVVLCQTC